MANTLRRQTTFLPDGFVRLAFECTMTGNNPEAVFWLELPRGKRRTISFYDIVISRSTGAATVLTFQWEVAVLSTGTVETLRHVLISDRVDYKANTTLGRTFVLGGGLFPPKFLYDNPGVDNSIVEASTGYDALVMTTSANMTAGDTYDVDVLLRLEDEPAVTSEYAPTTQPVRIVEPRFRDILTKRV